MKIKTNKMRQTFTFTIILLFLFTKVNSQELEKNFTSVEINKQVSEYPDRFDVTSPLNSFVTFKYLLSKGKQNLYRSVNSYRIKEAFPKSSAPDAEVVKEKRDALLHTKMKEIIIYKDSVAGIITDFHLPPMYIITYLSFEDGKWLNAGEGLGDDLIDAREKFKEHSKSFLSTIHRIHELKIVSSDTASFLNYLKDNGKPPKEFVLQALVDHKIVIYGELHRRKASWDLMRSIITDRKFVKTTGTIFIELSSDKQDELNRFFANEKLDTEIILEIFRSVQIDGWYDRGMYEFLIELWKLNKNLSEENRINVVAVDEPRPYDSFNNNDSLENYMNHLLDRNEQMAKIISETIASQKGERNNLFIVGKWHAYKSSVLNRYEKRPKRAATPAAAAQLKEIFSQGEVFSIFSHCPIIRNDGFVFGKIRNGLFDQVFAELGNRPIAFNLKNSPFGKEPFDGIYEMNFDQQTGSFENNFDAYLFLEPLESEPEEYELYDIITDKFVAELERRAKMKNETVEQWFDVKEVSKEAIISKLKSKYENKKRWPDL